MTTPRTQMQALSARSRCFVVIAVVAMAAAWGQTTAHAGSPPATVFAQVGRYDTIDVSDDTNSVSATTTFPTQPSCLSSNFSAHGQSGCRAWQLDMMNGGSTSMTGAQVAVDSTSSGLALNDTSRFNFQYSAQGPQGSPCPPPSLHQETCPAPGVTLAANGGRLDVSTSPDPQFGVPVGPITTGYDSARLVSSPANGISQVSVPVTLKDSARFGSSGFVAIGVASFNDNVVLGSATILGPDGVTPVPACPNGSPTASPCQNPPFYQQCTVTRCTNPGQVCTDASLNLSNAQFGTTYTFTFQEYVGNTSNSTTGNCGSVKSAVRIDSYAAAPPSPPTSCCSAQVTDPTLGAVTFSLDPGQTTGLQTQLVPHYVIQYGNEPQLQVQTYPFHHTEGLPFSGAVASFAEAGAASDSATAADYAATISWGDGSSSAGAVTAGGGPFFSVNGSHTYADEGMHPLSVTVIDKDTPWNKDVSAVGAGVGDAPLTATSGQRFHATYGVHNATVAEFADANPAATCADFDGTSTGPGGARGSITVTWDGTTTTQGTCLPDGTGAFVVRTNNPAAKPGHHWVSVTIVDDGGQSATATNSVIVTCNQEEEGQFDPECDVAFSGTTGQS
ncbi:MAG: hypothetical protein ACYDAC_00755 [Candidatus Dormibacteria bacterium]